MSNNSGWLVDYYYRHTQITEALALATRGAATQSRQGLVTYAHLAERLSRFDDAEQSYREAATHYQDASALIGFYYRTVVVRNDSRYAAALKTELARVFPKGLTPVDTLGGRPARAVIINSDNDLVRKAGLFIGFIIGLEGLRIVNLEQSHSRSMRSSSRTTSS